MTVTLQHLRYHLDRWIAAGGMGKVWQATGSGNGQRNGNAGGKGGKR